VLNKLKSVQELCDEISFDLNGSGINELETNEILQHKLFHLTKLLAKIGEVLEKNDHGKEYSVEKIKNEVIPDLIIYSLQLARVFDVDLNETYKDRLDFVISKSKEHYPKHYDKSKHSEVKNILKKIVEFKEDGYDF